MQDNEKQPTVASPIEPVVMCDMCENNKSSNKIISGPYGCICKECVAHCLDVVCEYHNVPTDT